MIKLTERKKLFIENFLVYGLGSVISKIIPVVMLPIITKIMKNSIYYGINDMVNLIITFGSAIVIMGVYDALFRLFFDKDDIEFKKDLCSSALYFILLSGISISILIIIFKKYILFLVTDGEGYKYLIIIIVLNIIASSINSIVSAPTRMNNNRKVFLIINFICPIISYGIAIPMLIKGLYIYALPLSALVSSIISSTIFYVINKKWFSKTRVSKKLIYELLKIGIPLMPTFIMYWICNSMDRIMIKSTLGLGELGIYSVAYKISSISQIIYTAFTMGWQYFVFSTMKDKDQKFIISKITNILLAISVISTIVISGFSRFIFNILAKGNYNEGSSLLPYLFAAPLMLMVFQSMSNQFLVMKKSVYVPIVLMSSVIVNFVLNSILIINIGIEGAAIATLVSYSVAVCICYIICVNLDIIQANYKILVNVLILFIYLFLWRFVSTYISNFIMVIIVLLISLMNIDFKKYVIEFLRK